jgi:hypothetical protein
VECADCHNPHAVRHNPIGQVAGTFGQTVKGATLYVSGVTITGRGSKDAQFLYEICFKCHGDSVNQPPPQISRQVDQNLRLAFQPSNPSFHPVAAPRRNEDVVSLIPPMRIGSVITCTDCHNSDNARAAGGTGPNGPHGSLFEPLLVQNYETSDFTLESAHAYALCYSCHRRESILTDESFSFHRLHIVQQGAPCSVCHDSHGVSRRQGSSVHNASLMNFDLSIVSSANTPAGRRIEYNDTGSFSGNCTLTCHGVIHVNFPYANPGRGVGRAALRGFSSGGRP